MGRGDVLDGAHVDREFGEGNLASPFFNDNFKVKSQNVCNEIDLSSQVFNVVDDDEVDLDLHDNSDPHLRSLKAKTQILFPEKLQEENN